MTEMYGGDPIAGAAGTSRRDLLRRGLVAGPVVLVGVLAGRQALTRLTAARPAGAAPSMQTPACVVTPQQTEGPYFVDERLVRSDIRADPATGAVSAGVPLRVAFRIAQVAGAGCTALAGAYVDLWHCDAEGVYSDVRDPGGSTLGLQFLRGSQLTDANGYAEFRTIYPGWYQGRTVHIHFKVRLDPDADTGYEFTSQLFFDDALTDTVFLREPYAAKGSRDTRNANDGIFRGGGDQLTLQIVQEGEGYAATIDVGVDLSQTGPDQAGPYPGPVGGGPPPIQGMPPPGARPPAGNAGPPHPAGQPATPPAQGIRP